MGAGRADLGRTRRNAITPHFTQRSSLRYPRLSRRLVTSKQDARHRDGESSRDNTSCTPLSTHDSPMHDINPIHHLQKKTIVPRSIDHPPMLFPFSPPPTLPCILVSPRRGQSMPPRRTWWPPCRRFGSQTCITAATQPRGIHRATRTYAPRRKLTTSSTQPAAVTPTQTQ